MIRITDSTLAMLEHPLPNKEDLHRFSKMLFAIGVDVIELSIQVYEQMEELPEEGKFMLHIDLPEQRKEYPGFYHYVCLCGREEGILNEIQINDVREINGLRIFDDLKEIKIVGLDDMLCKPFDKITEEIRNHIPNSRINFCPENTYGCASAMAVEWILRGGHEITTSFGGFSNKAATEEVLMALRLGIRHKPNRDLTILPELAQLFEKITKKKIENNKPIIGRHIFMVEAGIHADGLIKNPATYEAYDPKSVGGKREIIIGKHSGIKAIRLKLKELKIAVPSDQTIEKILIRVKDVSVKKKGSLTDEEFKKLAIEVMFYERSQAYC